MKSLPFLFVLLLPIFGGDLQAQQKICIDPGHGGVDPGAVGCGIRETDINLDTSLRLRDALLDNGFEVEILRTGDTTIALQNRAPLANAAGFISIHSNAADVVASGIETFCHTTGSQASFDLRDKIQEEMIAIWPLPNRGGKVANFAVLRETDMPATLTELGFVNNCAEDVVYLTNEAERQRAGLSRDGRQSLVAPNDGDPKRVRVSRLREWAPCSECLCTRHKNLSHGPRSLRCPPRLPLSTRAKGSAPTKAYDQVHEGPPWPSVRFVFYAKPALNDDERPRRKDRQFRPGQRCPNPYAYLWWSRYRDGLGQRFAGPLFLSQSENRSPSDLFLRGGPVDRAGASPHGIVARLIVGRTRQWSGLHHHDVGVEEVLKDITDDFDVACGKASIGGEGDHRF